jgi:hypothetical protein
MLFRFGYRWQCFDRLLRRLIRISALCLNYVGSPLQAQLRRKPQ